MKTHKNKNFHKHDGYSRWHPTIQKHQADLHKDDQLEPVSFIKSNDIMKARDEFIENQELLSLFDDLIQKTDEIDLLYKLDDLISKLMYLELNNVPQNSEVIDAEDGVRAPNPQVGMP